MMRLSMDQRIEEIKAFMPEEDVEQSLDGLPDEVIDLMLKFVRICSRAKELTHQLVGMRNN